MTPERPGASASEMAHACALDPFAISRAIAQLVERAFAKRRAARADRRFAAVTVMACGRAVFDEIAALGRLIETELCAALSAAERARFNRAQTRGRERASRWRACRRARARDAMTALLFAVTARGSGPNRRRARNQAKGLPALERIVFLDR